MTIRSIAAFLSRASQFLSRQDGVTAVEFALLAPIFLLCSLMFAEFGLYQIEAAALSYATQAAARQILLGNVAKPGTADITTFINQDVCTALPPLMSCSNVVVNVTVVPQNSSWSSKFNASNTGLQAVTMDNTKTKFCIGGNGSVVALAVYYKIPLFVLPLFSGSSNYSTYIYSTAAFKNEPFTTTYHDTGC